MAEQTISALKMSFEDYLSRYAGQRYEYVDRPPDT